jgi:hypothetical protein
VAVKIVVQVAYGPTVARSMVLGAAAGEDPLARPASTPVAVAATAASTATRPAVRCVTPTWNLLFTTSLVRLRTGPTQKSWFSGPQDQSVITPLRYAV